MKPALPILLMLALGGCAAAKPPAPQGGQRVVSLDYCADQMVLGLLPPSRIAAVSPEAQSDASFAGPRAKSVAKVRPTLEEIVRLRPTHVVRLYGGAPGIERQLTALGISVVQLDIAQRLSDVPGQMTRIGKALDAEQNALSLNRDFAAAVKGAAVSGSYGAPPTMLYMTPGDVTTGPDSFVADVIAAAGFKSVRSEAGWGSLPVEAMVRRPPDTVLRAFFDSPRYRQDRWSAALHPRLQAVIAVVPTATVPGSSLACGNWLAGDAVRAVAALRRQIGVTS